VVVLKETVANKFEVREKLPTVKMGRTSLYDANSDRLFVGVPGKGDKDSPEVRVYRPR
jgi:hypothetical protein